MKTRLIPLLLALTLAACAPENNTPPSAREIADGDFCTLDGMLLNDFPGPKAQIHYAGQAQPDLFCDTVEMFSLYLKPEQQKRITALFVQDMGAADWQAPRGHWIDAKTALYVEGSKKHGSMGPTLASFAKHADAEAFAKQHGGKVLRFDEVTPAMVVLDGGANHDKRM